MNRGALTRGWLLRDFELFGLLVDHLAQLGLGGVEYLWQVGCAAVTRHERLLEALPDHDLDCCGGEAHQLAFERVAEAGQEIGGQLFERLLGGRVGGCLG